MATTRTRAYTSGQVARALKVPVRRIEGWAEQGLISPKVVRGRTRHGDRRQYTWDEIITAAVLAEAQKLLGAHFRPGGMAELVRAVGAKSYGLLGAVMPASYPAVLVLRVVKDQPKIEVLYRPSIDHLPTTALLINISRLGHEVREALDREH